MNVEEVLRVVARDDIFYKQSGGGVTLSGENHWRNRISRMRFCAVRMSAGFILRLKQRVTQARRWWGACSARVI